MKRVSAACIVQTLVFGQKPEIGYSVEQAKRLNLEELEKYKSQLNRTNTRYQITDETVEADGSIVIHVRKQYNDAADVSEYFE